MADGGDSMDVVLAGTALRLYADRALYWPARRRLLVADLHLGKDDTFRAAGIALPTGGTRHDLDRLSALIEQSGAQAVWFLGDLLHGPLLDTHWREDWTRFRARHAGLEMLLVEGNHDRAAARAGLGIEHRRHSVEETGSELVFAHAPQPTPGDERVVVCGHLHPVVRVPGFRGRFPAFTQIDRHFVLPAFSTFTGGWLVRDALSRHACMHGHLLDMGPTR
ncbi:ligase-associated DNA damage response endonuclease PdeM [Hydrogenophaga sp.]|uniref:ligase-associated DNA damage response endonuclease PdeM n=1 Tax=Hydrogenophaga sp. TaxID=1904254 RepID=UPI003F6F4D7B